jgi:BlaI family transcriptional regulator, penicillinase repressor
LWELGSGTVSEVRAALLGQRAYTTVLTILRNLEVKGVVSHTSTGRAHRFTPSVSRFDVQRITVSQLINRFFHGSAYDLVVQMIEDRRVTAQALSRLRAGG